MQAEDIKIDSDEDGFYLDVMIDESQWEWVEGNTIRLRVADPERLYDSVKARIGPWLRERDEAFAAFRCNPDESGGLAEGIAYDMSDPKHPDYHSIHVDLYDQAEGK